MAALDLVAFRFVPLLLGAVLMMGIGAAWYGIFAKPWMAMAHPGKTRAQMSAGPKWPYAIAAAAALVLSYAFGVIVEATGRALANTLTLAAVLSAALVLLYLTTYAFAAKPLKLALIDVGYYVTSLFVFGLAYGLV